MSRELDRRDFSVNRVTPARQAELRSLASEVSDQLPGSHRVLINSFDAVTGNPSIVVSESAPAETGNYIQRALDHVQSISRVLGLEATQPTEFTADPQTQQTSSGAVTVHLQQQYKGIPIFQAAETVRFDPDGLLLETVGNSITVTEELPVSPRLSVQPAVLRAAQHVAVPDAGEQTATDQFGEPLDPVSVDLRGFVPKVTATFNQANRPAVLEPGPFGDKIKASLIWFLLRDTLRLAWEVIITMPGYTGQYRTLVDADTGEILYCRQLMEFVVARGNVYQVDGSSARQMISFPRSLEDYGLPIPDDLPRSPQDFPDDWVEGDRTIGNSTNAHLGELGPALRANAQNGILTFDPADPLGDDQKILNIFYYNCYMHDYFYLLGFREADGNFQRNNFNRGGIPGDRVDARAHSGRVVGTANMFTPVDGSSPVMNMGLVTSTNRHTAFDSSVVFHEFMHGVTNRLVGGSMNARALEAPQSAGMGEGLSDYIACTINDSTVVGSWVTNRPGGIRGFPYTSSFPDNFGNLGTGRYAIPDSGPQRGEIPVHNIGEIWCAALLEMNRKVGAQWGVQLVMDALKLSPANPSFLDMRDAILRAVENRRVAGLLSQGAYVETRRGVWAALAKFGMGPDARSNGASLSGVVADFNLPPDLTEAPPSPSEPTGPRVQVEATPQLAIPDHQLSGVTHVLTVAETGRVRRLAVSVDIEHSYIGDLQVSLVTPLGSTIVLHSRTGASTKNLIKTYTGEDVSNLLAIAGEPVQGDWTLKIADLAPQDVGVLRRWSLDISITSEVQSVRGEATSGLAIPDNNPQGISSAIAISPTGQAQELKVSVDITHTYIGDLRLVLAAPSGEQVILHDRAGGSQDNLIRTYDSLAHLEPLINQPIQGDWTLSVSDLSGRDVGKLNQWSLELTYRP